MNEIMKARIKFFSILLIAIVIAHIVVIHLLFRSGAAPETVPAAEPVAQAAAPVTPPEPVNSAVEPPAAPVAAPAAPARQPDKPGFWARLFGSKAKVAEPLPPPPPPKPAYRYRRQQPPANFAKPFNYAHALRGDLPAKTVPGSSGARSGFMVDLDTRNVLWEKNSDKAVPIASMVKMMTMLVTFDELERNRAISLDTPVKITPVVNKVPRTGVIWLDTRETFPLSDLMKAVAIKSANDAATQVAEFIGGDVDSFIRKMNEKATEIGMGNSRFVSPCGLKDKAKGNSTSSARDMVIIAERLLEIPQVMQWSTTKQDFIREGEKKTMLTTTNKLVNPRWPGVDGLKTGFTNDAGYCLTFSVLRDGRRIVGCVTGFSTGRDRDRFCRKLIDWGYAKTTALK